MEGNVKETKIHNLRKTPTIIVLEIYNSLIFLSDALIFK